MGHMVKPPVILEIIVRIKSLELKHNNREVGIRRFQAGMFVSAHPQLSLSSSKCGMKLSEAFRGRERKCLHRQVMAEQNFLGM